MCFFSVLKANSITVSHIGNPAYHLNLETSFVFLEKTKTAIENLVVIINSGKFPNFESKINSTYFLLKKLKLVSLTAFIFNKTESKITANLLSENPSLFLFDLYKLGYYCLIAALCLIICFGQQKEDGFFKGLARSVVRLPLDIITWIGNLSDLVSYVRLFAVGMSTKEVAVAFNNMAFNIGFDTLPAMFATVLVLLGGHSVNLLLGAMAILVHGIRLNVLEFSKHLSIEWSGVPYDPFREPEP